MKDYFLSLKPFFVFAVSFFILSAIVGFFLSKQFPGQALFALRAIRTALSLIFQEEPVHQLIFVFLNNSISLFLALLFSLFLGISPLLILAANGAILGALFFFLRDSLPISLFLAGLLPHGLIELPILFLTCSAGLKTGKSVLDALLGREGGIKKEFFASLKFFFKILLPFLFLAAVIEIFITPGLLKLL